MSISSNIDDDTKQAQIEHLPKLVEETLKQCLSQGIVSQRDYDHMMHALRLHAPNHPKTVHAVSLIGLNLVEAIWRKANELAESRQRGISH